MRNILTTLVVSAALQGALPAVVHAKPLRPDAAARATVAPLGDPTLVESHDAAPAGLKAIFSNIDYDHPKARYGWDWGYTVAGTQAGQVWLAAPFTPKRDFVVHQVDLAMLHANGATGFVLGIASDEGGLPGAELFSHTVRKMPELGTCCKLVRVSDEVGIPVVGGQTYWITVTTNAKQATAAEAWNYNLIDMDHPMPGAWNLGEGWTATEEFGIAPAFAVWGR